MLSYIVLVINIVSVGLAGVHTQYEPQLNYFAHEKGDEYSVCLVDNRGCGLSDTPAGRWKTTDFASDYIQLLIQMSLSSREGEGVEWSHGLMGFI